MGEKVRIAVPTGGRPWATTVRILDVICRNADLPPVAYMIAGFSAADSKARIVKWFLEDTDDDYLIMVDHDVEPPIHLLNILKHKLDIVGGVYLLNLPAVAKVPFLGVFKEVSEGQYMPIDDVMARKGLVECDMVGGGCLCLSRKVLLDIKPAFVFCMDEWGVLKKTEDTWFCEQARKKGYKVFADYEIMCEHHKEVPLAKTMTRLLEAVRITGGLHHRQMKFDKIEPEGEPHVD